jgi:hypothetical protein
MVSRWEFWGRWSWSILMCCFGVFCPTEENHDTFQSGYQVTGPRFKPDTSQVQLCSVTAKLTSSIKLQQETRPLTPQAAVWRVHLQSSPFPFVSVKKSPLQDDTGVSTECDCSHPPLNISATPCRLLGREKLAEGFDLLVGWDGGMHNQNLQSEQGSIKRNKRCYCGP